MNKVAFRIFDKYQYKYLDESCPSDFKECLIATFEGRICTVESIAPGRYRFERYIGEKDIHSKKVFEGDIVMFDWWGGEGKLEAHVGTVYWDGLRTAFLIDCNGGEDLFAPAKVDSLEVIGNVHEGKVLR